MSKFSLDADLDRLAEYYAFKYDIDLDSARKVVAHCLSEIMYEIRKKDKQNELSGYIEDEISVRLHTGEFKKLEGK